MTDEGDSQRPTRFKVIYMGEKMDNIIKKRRPEYAITEEEIKEVEERFEIVFPKVLRDFYLEHNGDYIKNCFFFINENEYSVQDMHYIKIEKEASVEVVLQWQREDGLVPNDLVPFAYDMGGESFYWSTENQGVYFLDIEDPCIANKICNSIEKFFKIIEEAEPYIIKGKM